MPLVYAIKRIVVTGYMVLQLFGLNAQRHFENYTASNGFPYNNVAAIIQDQRGFVWLGSSDGLIKFDGITFTTYTHSDIDSNSLPDNNINCLFTDKKGLLWIGTRGGLSSYNPATDKFRNFYHQDANKNSISSNEIWSIGQDTFENIWAGTLNDGLNCIRFTVEGNYEVTRYQHDVNSTSSLSDNAVWCLYFDKNGYGWAGTEHGLNRFQPQKKNCAGFMRFYQDKTEARSISNNFVWRIGNDSQNNLWITSLYGTVDILPAASSASPVFLSATSALQSVLTFPITDLYDIAFDHNGMLWVSANGKDLFRCRPILTSTEISFKDVFVFSSEQRTEKGESGNFTWKLFKDRNNLMWAGNAKGFAIYDAYKEQFYHVSSDTRLLLNNKLPATDVFGISSKSLWIAADDSLFIISKGKKYAIDFNELGITNIYYTESSGAWAGTFSGLFYASPAAVSSFLSGSAKTISFQNASTVFPECPSFERVNFFATGYEDLLLIGGAKKLVLVHTNSNTLHSLEWAKTFLPAGSSQTYRTAAVDKHLLFLGTDDGLFIFDMNKQTLVRKINKGSKPALISNRIHALSVLPGNRLGVGTPNGFCIYNIAAQTIQHFTTNNGLPDNNIRSIVTVGTEAWLATRNGLCAFNLQNNSMRIFTTANGLASNQLNALQYDHLNKNLLVASDDGVNVLSVSGKFDAPPVPSIAFTDFLIHGKPVIETAPELAGDFRMGKSMKLNYKQNYFTIAFAALSFSDTKSNRYAYKLDGFDTGWVYSAMPTATYTNLAAGNYTFRVKAANSYGNWNQDGITMTILITPPWWQTNLFYVSCVIFIAGVLYAIYRIRLSRLLAEQAMRNKIASDLHDDIGSSLSGISIYSELAKSRTENDHPELYRMLSAISENTRITQQNMQDIVWSINPYNDSFEKIITRMKTFAAEVLEPKGIAIQFESDDALNKMDLASAKRKNLFLIFKEAINNCAKYANCKTVQISICKKDSKLELIIKDDGKGFDQHITSHKKSLGGNGLKTMQSRAIEMEGECTVHSELGTGTVVKLLFKAT